MTEFLSWVLVGITSLVASVAILVVALVLFSPFIILIWAALVTFF